MKGETINSSMLHAASTYFQALSTLNLLAPTTVGARINP